MWSSAAQAQLDFWREVDFGALRASISADVLGQAIESTFHYPAMLDLSEVSILYQDASAVAAGGGMLEMSQGCLREAAGLFLAEFTMEQAKASSTFRELVGILWCMPAVDCSYH